ncbi:GlcG/HbpS family heme-binding protein [Noviherbaspirillum sp. Root189]|uniref:GlcG/HbpS family heme-binding protein n=1 Tax=Noviherbaspirillum sp. Root189 TaxID=1736487 RepID=UPI00070B47FF|nr:heme-binding protein [Noviherbaspirillum sp. Root189]KRB81017.1 cobalamin adenosyltransferase [Noviherbaspirillum sp. Root189]
MNQEIGQPQLTWQTAHQAIEAAVRQALELGVRINVSVVDAGGVPLAFLRMHGAPLHSIEISEDKAYTAVSFGLATSQWTDALKTHSEAVRQGLPLRPRFVMFGGGLPMRCGSELIGGIGVSGGSEQQDEQCAKAGLAAIGLQQ